VSSQPLPGRLSPDLWQALHGIKCVRVYPKGTILFHHGAEVGGVYVVESGHVRLLLPTGQGQTQLLDVAGPGTILGLSESMSGDCHRVSVEAGDHTTVGFIPRTSFIEFLRDHSDYCMQVVRILSEDLHGLYHKFRSISAHPGRPRHRAPDEQLN
jgi:CRP-like cAMP-binding protein